MKQTYDIHRSYQENYDAGPQFFNDSPDIPVTPLKSFLGIPVRSRVGIAAGLLLNSKWILGYAKRGFDILTYKTVRSAHRPCYNLPNWVFVDDGDATDGPVRVIGANELPDDPSEISSAVCFGMPSMPPDVWRADVALAKAGMAEGQMLIVSVVATPQPGASREAVAEDFAQCAKWAVDAGADAVEANLSCPNVCTPEGTIYQDVELSRFIALGCRKAIGDAPLLLKVGRFLERKQLGNFLREMSGVASGVTLVNGISRPVLRRDGTPAFGKDYVNAGVLGRAIHQPSVDNVRDAAAIITDEGLDLELAAVGGISRPDDAGDFFDAGAAAVLMGSSPMYLPCLAAEIKAARPDW